MIAGTVRGSLTDHPDAPAFARSLQESHIDELGFLLDHRRALLRMGRWQDTGRTEQRIAAQLVAIDVHRPTVLDLAVELLAEDDPSIQAGAAYAIAAFGEGNHRAALLAALTAPAPACVLRALGLAPATGLAVDLASRLGSSDDAFVTSAAVILSHRREVPAERLLEVATTLESNVALAAVATALSRSGERASRAALYAGWQRNPSAFPLLAAMAVASDPEGIRLARLCLRQPDDFAPGDLAALMRTVALAGDAADVASIVERARKAPLPALESLGLMGYGIAVPVLLDYVAVDEEPVRRAAGVALELITGAGLPAETATPEENEGDDTDDDLDAAPAGLEDALPVCVNAEAWRAYWVANSNRFSGSRQRYRRGRPWTAATALDALQTLPLPLGQRQLEADELAARTGLAPLEADWFLPRQQAHFALMQSALR